MTGIPTNSVASAKYFSANAFLVFIDIKNSSTYGKYYKIGIYASLVDVFKKKFHEITDIFFKEHVDDLGDGYEYKPECRGDEGFVCLMMPPEYDDEILKKLALRILSYLHILKASLYTTTYSITKTPIDIAVGIHFGEIAKLDKKDICGYSINFTKRIESESRNGHHTGIFVSKEIKDILRNSDVIFDKHLCNISGSNKNEVIYEIQYSYVDIAEILEENERTQITEIFKKDDPESIQNILLYPTLLISLFLFFVKQKINEKYFELKLKDMLWHNIYEKNPTILLVRGRHYEKKGEEDPCAYLSAIRYYKQALTNYPNYTRAAIEMSRLLNKMSEYCRGEIAEGTAIAHDLISNFDGILREYKKEIKDALKEVREDKQKSSA